MRVRGLSQLRPRTVWDVLDDAFDLYRERFAVFAGIAAVVLVPGYLALIPWITSITVASADRASSSPDGLLGILFGRTALLFPIFGLAFVIFGGATAAAVDDHLADRPTSLAAAYRRVFRRFWPLLGAACIVQLLCFFAAALTFCLLGLGALAVIVLYAFVPQAVVLEANGAAQAGKRSRELVQSGNADKVLGLLLVLSLMSVFLSFGISSILQTVLALIPGPGDVAARELRNALLSQSVSTVVSILLAPLAPIATTLLYYDVRVRREGLDMEAQAAAIGYPLAPDPFGGIPSEVARRQAAQAARSAAQESRSPRA